MSVLIKSIDMPQTCTGCPLRIGKFCLPLKRDTSAWNRQDRAKDCPLVEVPKHGRLIDAGALVKKWIWGNTDRTRNVECIELSDLMDAPTILEAEE